MRKGVGSKSLPGSGAAGKIGAFDTRPSIALHFETFSTSGSFHVWSNSGFSGP